MRPAKTRIAPPLRDAGGNTVRSPRIAHAKRTTSPLRPPCGDRGVP